MDEVVTRVEDDVLYIGEKAYPLVTSGRQQAIQVQGKFQNPFQTLR